MLPHDWTNPRSQVAMALGKFIVSSSVCDSNCSCFTAILQFPEQYDCITHFFIAGSENGVQ
jgi:hypothetical protein